MIIGNDVVDLLDRETKEEGLHRRFDRRVFSDAEQKCIQMAQSSHQMRWHIWAAKESAYKVAKKLDGKTIFSPVQFSVRLGHNGFGDVCFNKKRFALSVQSSEQHVHAVASYAPQNVSVDVPACYSITHPKTWLHQTPSMSQHKKIFLSQTFFFRSGFETNHSPSLVARKLLRRILGSVLCIPSKEIELVRENRIPQVRWRGTLLPMDLSLSHHGRIVAFALYYRESTEC